MIKDLSTLCFLPGNLLPLKNGKYNYISLLKQGLDNLGVTTDIIELENQDVLNESVSEELLKTWNVQTTPIDRVWVNLAWSPELRLLVAVSHGATADGVMTSPDGQNWTARTCPAQEWRGVAWSPKLMLFAAVGGTGTGNRVMTSPDGITWTSGISTGDYKWRSIVWSDEKEMFVAVANTTGFTDKVMTSTDGITWTARTTPDRAWSDIVYAPELGLFVVSATGGIAGSKIMTSPDGITWTLRETPGDLASWEGIGYSEDLRLLVAVSYYGSVTAYPGQRVMTSPDGINWTLRDTPLDAQWLDVAWSHELGMFAAVNDSDAQGVMVSPDGINWTLRTPDATKLWRRIIWVKELGSFVSVAYTFSLSGVGNLIMMSKPIDMHQQYLALRGRTLQTIDGQVVTNDDMTINGHTVGRGGGDIAGNIALGFETLKNNTVGPWNTAIGYQALKNNTYKGWNTAIGLFTMTNYVDTDVVSQAGNNTAIGASALRFLTTARWNTAIGANAFTSLTTGGFNTGLGVGAGKGITTGTHNTIVGIFETLTFASTPALSNTVVLGDGAGDIRFYSPVSKNILFGTTTDIPSSKLTIESTTQGFLPPRMTAAQASAIVSPAEGLMLYVTNTDVTFTTKGWWGYNGTIWQQLNN